MRAVLIGVLAATLAGCSCRLPPQSGMETCTDANGFACFDRTAASQPVEPKPASFQTDSATIEIKSTITAKTEKPSSAYARDSAHLAIKTAKPTMIAAKAEASASRIPLSPRSLRHDCSPQVTPLPIPIKTEQTSRHRIPQAMSLRIPIPERYKSRWRPLRRPRSE